MADKSDRTYKRDIERKALCFGISMTVAVILVAVIAMVIGKDLSHSAKNASKPKFKAGQTISLKIDGRQGIIAAPGVIDGETFTYQVRIKPSKDEKDKSPNFLVYRLVKFYESELDVTSNSQ